MWTSSIYYGVNQIHQNYFRVIPYLTDQETMFSLEFWTFFEIYLTQIAYVRRQTIID